jgi:5-formyltetrahydrofolate cyclo-ligase
MLALRNSKPAQELDALSTQINARLVELPEINDANVVSTYLYIGSEVRTASILDWLLSNGKRVIVPVTDRLNRRLIFCEIKSPEQELTKGTFGILEPKPEFRRPLPLEQADVILVPGVAWDLRGYRIGYGAGYYDRSINSMRKFLPKIGLSYEFQIVKRIPNGRFDRKVNKLVTERRIINTNSN